MTVTTATVTTTDVKTFTIGGFAVDRKGNPGVKACNGDLTKRIKVLEKDGFTDVIFITLPNAMTKREVAQHIKDLPEFNFDLAQKTIAAFLAAPVAKEVKPKAVKATVERKKAEPTATIEPEAKATVDVADVIEELEEYDATAEAALMAEALAELTLEDAPY